MSSLRWTVRKQRGTTQNVRNADIFCEHVGNCIYPSVEGYPSYLSWFKALMMSLMGRGSVLMEAPSGFWCLWANHLDNREPCYLFHICVDRGRGLGWVRAAVLMTRLGPGKIMLEIFMFPEVYYENENSFITYPLVPLIQPRPGDVTCHTSSQVWVRVGDQVIFQASSILDKVCWI